mmetsp:Transcript_79638/g.231206  ORF Transcript_79638/g.231206 Transcript_79638/m.231206 type:complete len:283 (-) Transcript_79638:352-1200(-)
MLLLLMLQRLLLLPWLLLLLRLLLLLVLPVLPHHLLLRRLAKARSGNRLCQENGEMDRRPRIHRRIDLMAGGTRPLRRPTGDGGEQLRPPCGRTSGRRTRGNRRRRQGPPTCRGERTRRGGRGASGRRRRPVHGWWRRRARDAAANRTRRNQAGGRDPAMPHRRARRELSLHWRRCAEEPRPRGLPDYGARRQHLRGDHRLAQRLTQQRWRIQTSPRMVDVGGPPRQLRGLSDQRGPRGRGHRAALRHCGSRRDRHILEVESPLRRGHRGRHRGEQPIPAGS